MADGKTHTRTQVETAAIYLTPAFILWGKFNYSPIWFVWVGILLGIFITPDLDIDHRKIDGFQIIKSKSPLLAWVWRMFWIPYSKLFSHGQSSHWPILGTLVRFAYFFAIPFMLGFRDIEILSALFFGLALADLNHIFMDLPTGTSRLFEIFLVIIHISVSIAAVNFLIKF